MNKQITVDQIEAVRCSIDEAETTFIIERNSDIVKVWSSDNTYITKLKRCMRQNPDEFKCFEGSRDQDNYMTGYFFEFPKKRVSIRSKQRTLSDEQKAQATQRLKKARATKNNKENN